MRKWILLLIFLIAMAAGFVVAQDPGYALFVYKDWMVQMPLWLACLLVLLLLFFLYILMRSLQGFLGLQHIAMAWWRWRRYRQTSSAIKKRVTQYKHIQQLIAEGQQEAAEYALRKILKHELNIEALRLYQSLDILTEKRYKQALRWQKKHPDHPALLALLGKLANELKLWGLARKYYETSLALAFEPEVSLHYADFLLAQQEKDLALNYYRKGLLIASSQIKNREDGPGL